tara:strand:+ start:125 stop:643 length:519 start_codon:yes stop_codon:yes gene_type:complete
MTTKKLVNELLSSTDYRNLAMTNEEFVADVLPNVYQPIDASSRGPGCVGWDLEDHENEVDPTFLEAKQICPVQVNGKVSRLQAAHCDRWKPDSFTFTYVNHAERLINVFYTKNNPEATKHFAKQDIVTFNTDFDINEKNTMQNINTKMLLECDWTIVNEDGTVISKDEYDAI